MQQVYSDHAHFSPVKERKILFKKRDRRELKGKLMPGGHSKRKGMMNVI